MTRHPIVCLEGPSAAGKSAIAHHLSEHVGYAVIPEVNVRFRGRARKGANWYFERQIDRYQEALAHNDDGGRAVLDGDPFQPLWYNWIYRDFGPLERVIDFYQRAIDHQRIRFPDLYVIIQASVADLATRRANDISRRRRNFDRHLQMIAPQRSYFEQLRSFDIVEVEFVENHDVISSAMKVAQWAQQSCAREGTTHQLSALSAFLRTNAPRFS